MSKEYYGFFHNKYKGEECILIANGPSLEKTPIDFWKSRPSFGCNRISFRLPEFCPTYYIGLGANHSNTVEKRATMLPMLADDRLKGFFINRLIYHEFDYGEYTDKMYSILGP